MGHALQARALARREARLPADRRRHRRRGRPGRDQDLGPSGKRLADNGLKTLLLSPDALIGRYLARDEVNVQTGEIYAEAGDELDAPAIASLEEKGFTTIDVLDIDHVTVGAYM